MADQMAGQWYLRACELGQHPEDRVKNFVLSSLRNFELKTEMTLCLTYFTFLMTCARFDDSCTPTCYVV